MASSHGNQVGENGSVSQGLQFFKVFSPNPSANLRIPPKFRTYLPHKIPKSATLSGPCGKNWHVEIRKNNDDIFFTKGWSDFAKAHDLRTGYLLVFRYVGNMVFNVTIYDTTCCSKEYLRTPVQSTRYDTEIEDSYESSDNDAEMEISSDYPSKRRKVLTGKVQRVLEKEKGSTSKKLTQKGEKKTRPNIIGRKGKAKGQGKEKFIKEKKSNLQKKNPVKIIQDSMDNIRQFEMIICPSALKHRELYMPRKFFMKNGLGRIGKQPFYLKREVDGRSWVVKITFREYQAKIRKGWSKFARENGLQVGDQIAFKIVSHDTVLVKLINPARQHNASKGESGSKIRKKNMVTKRQISPKQSTEESETSTTVKHFHLTMNYIHISNRFCVKNKLTSSRDVILKDLEGKEWVVNFYRGKAQGRFNSKGWKNFSTEKGLKEGDKCIFKLIAEDTVFVHVIKAEQE